MIPENAKPIVDFNDAIATGGESIIENSIPLCPHCGEWSYYTTDEAEANGGFTVCPFCGGAMYMEERA